MAATRPMSVTGGTLNYKGTSTSTKVYEIEPLHPLDKVMAEPSIDSIDLKTGETKRVDTIALKGLNLRGGAYYGFQASRGHWELVDAADPTKPADGSIATLAINGITGQAILTAVGEGTVYLKYVSNEDCYSYSGSPRDAFGRPTDFKKNANLTTAVIPVNITTATATVSGQVLDSLTNAGLGGAQVILKKGGSEIANAVTGSDGKYSLPNIPAGNDYTITAKRSGYTDNTSVTFDVKGADVTQNVYLSQVTYSVSGKITDSNGNGLDSALVTLKYRNDDVDMTVTEADGSYVFANVPPGNAYTITASLRGYETDSTSFNVSAAVANKNLAL